jgi:hypothetical protein
MGELGWKKNIDKLDKKERTEIWLLRIIVIF